MKNLFLILLAVIISTNTSYVKPTSAGTKAGVIIGSVLATAAVATVIGYAIYLNHNPQIARDKDYIRSLRSSAQKKVDLLKASNPAEYARQNDVLKKLGNNFKNIGRDSFKISELKDEYRVAHQSLDYYIGKYKSNVNSDPKVENAIDKISTTLKNINPENITERDMAKLANISSKLDNVAKQAPKVPARPGQENINQLRQEALNNTLPKTKVATQDRKPLDKNSGSMGLGLYEQITYERIQANPEFANIVTENHPDIMLQFLKDNPDYLIKDNPSFLLDNPNFVKINNDVLGNILNKVPEYTVGGIGLDIPVSGIPRAL